MRNESMIILRKNILKENILRVEFELDNVSDRLHQLSSPIKYIQNVLLFLRLERKLKAFRTELATY